MNEENKILQMPGISETVSVEEISENNENKVDEIEEKKAIEDENNPLDENSMKNLQAMIKQTYEMVNIVRNIWESDIREYNVNESYMKQLYQYNEQHKISLEDSKLGENEEYDTLNGLDNIPMEEIIKIFGEGHKIIGIDETHTRDRIKTVSRDFFQWVSAMKEYQQIQDGYMMLVDIEEEKNIKTLELIVEKETDIEKKKKMQASIDLYYRNNNLDFLADKLDEKVEKQIIDAFSNQRKIEYWIRRTRDKLKQIKLPSKYILEISQFEKRFLAEKYHKASNVLLLYFMHKIIYTNLYEKDNPIKIECVSMVINLDKFVRNKLSDERKEKIKSNVISLIEQVIDKLPEKGIIDDEK